MNYEKFKIAHCGTVFEERPNSLAKPVYETAGHEYNVKWQDMMKLERPTWRFEPADHENELKTRLFSRTRFDVRF